MTARPRTQTRSVVGLAVSERESDSVETLGFRHYDPTEHEDPYQIPWAGVRCRCGTEEVLRGVSGGHSSSCGQDIDTHRPQVACRPRRGGRAPTTPVPLSSHRISLSPPSRLSALRHSRLYPGRPGCSSTPLLTEGGGGAVEDPDGAGGSEDPNPGGGGTFGRRDAGER